MFPRLPILDILPEVKNTLRSCNTLILQAPPGAGKSTLLPLEIMNEPWLEGKKMIMLEPRRLAARSVASRMASLLNEPVGETVGYRIRFESRVSAKTRIEVVTEGILTRLLQSDPTLEGVGLILFDEFHERSLHADLALALSLQVQQVLRNDLKILLMSATMDGNKLSSALGSAPVLSCEGKQFPVTLRYLEHEDTLSLPVQMAKAIRKAFVENEGDILAFFPGAGEINRTRALLEEDQLAVALHTLYGDLPQQQQQEALQPDTHGRRKIVLSTSIAETSLTIEGVTVIVDSGFSRVPRFDARTGLTRLETIKVTKDTADQRAGRAGRLGPGVCYRLWSEGTNLHLIPHRKPEIMEADLSSLLLEVAQWGLKDINGLSWITVPPPVAVNQARELLQQLDALNRDMSITPRGKDMLRLPTHPRMAHMLLEARKEDEATKTPRFTALSTDIAALLEERDPLQKEAGTDLGLRLDALRKWRKKERVNADRAALERIERSAMAWRKLMKTEADNATVVESDTGKLLAAAYPERIAKRINRNDNRYRLANGRIAKLAEHDPLAREEWLSIAHMDAGSNEGKIFLAAALDPSDLLHLAKERESVGWNDERGMIQAVRETYIGNITLESKTTDKISEEERLRILCSLIRKEGLKIIGWAEQHSEWQGRVLSTKAWRPEEDWPDVSDEQLLSGLEEWLAPYLAGIHKRSELQRLDLDAILSGVLPWEKNKRLDELAPATLKVPSGSMIKLLYSSDGRPPEMAVRLQEVFGWHETPTVNEGRTKVLLHLLSPGYKPVQLTQDLHSFWSKTYAEVRKELRIRYQKHHWPEDPWTAEAVRGAKKRNK